MYTKLQVLLIFALVSVVTLFMVYVVVKLDSIDMRVSGVIDGLSGTVMETTFIPDDR